MNVEEVVTIAQTMALEYGPKLIGAIVVWIVGSWVIKLLVSAFGKVIDRSKLDASLKPFLCSIIGTLLKVMLAIYNDISSTKLSAAIYFTKLNLLKKSSNLNLQANFCPLC